MFVRQTGQRWLVPAGTTVHITCRMHEAQAQCPQGMIAVSHLLCRQTGQSFDVDKTLLAIVPGGAVATVADVTIAEVAAVAIVVAMAGVASVDVVSVLRFLRDGSSRRRDRLGVAVRFSDCC
jgi:hypothetical protein